MSAIERSEINSSRVRRDVLVNAFGATFTAAIPEIMATKKGAAEGNQVNPFRATSFIDEWDNFDGFDGLKLKLEAKLDAFRLDVTARIEAELQLLAQKPRRRRRPHKETKLGNQFLAFSVEVEIDKHGPDQDGDTDQ